MPKARNKRGQQSAAAPEPSAEDVALSDIPAPPVAQPMGGGSGPKVVPAVKKLKSLRKNEKWQGCCDVAALSLEGPASIEKLMASNAAASLVQLFHDASPSVRLAATRALINLTLGGDDSQASHIVRLCPPSTQKSLLIASLAALKQAIDNPPAPKPKKEGAEEEMESGMGESGGMGFDVQNEVEAAEGGSMVEDEALTPELMGECAVEVMQFMSAVGYFSEDCVCNLGADVEVLQALVDCTQMHTVQTKSTTLATASAELLLLFCDENPTALHALNSQISSAHQQILSSTLSSKPVSPSQVLTKIILTGLLLQLHPHMANQLLPFVFETVQETQPHALCERLVKMQVANDHDRVLKRAATQQLVTKMKALKTCLEICVNLVCSADLGDADDDEGAFARTNIGVVLGAAKIGQVMGAKAAELLAQCPSEACEVALRDSVSTPYDEVHEQYTEVETAMVVLLMNLLMVFPLPAVGSPDALWTALQSVFARDASLISRVAEAKKQKAADEAAKAPTNPTELNMCSADKSERTVLLRLEKLCSCLWTILRKGRQVNAADTSDDLKFVTNLLGFLRTAGAASPDLIVSGLRLTAEGFSGGARGGAAYAETVKTLGQFCMDSLKEENLAVSVEGVNCIIDVFSEDDYDCLMKQLNMLRHLTAYAQALPAKLNALSGDIDEELGPRLEVVTSNLQPFIEYKAARLQ